MLDWLASWRPNACLVSGLRGYMNGIRLYEADLESITVRFALLKADLFAV